MASASLLCRITTVYFKLLKPQAHLRNMYFKVQLPHHRENTASALQRPTG